MKKPEIYITKSPEETKKIGYKLAKKIGFNTVLFIKGELGAGKTTFIKGFLEFFGFKDTRSPSFLYVYEYPIPGGKIYHIDLFRTEEQDINEKLNLKEIMEEKAIFLIEWPEKIKNFKINLKSVNVHIKITKKDNRIIEIYL